MSEIRDPVEVSALKGIAAHLGPSGMAQVRAYVEDALAGGVSGVDFENDGLRDGSTPYSLSVGSETVEVRHGRDGGVVTREVFNQIFIPVQRKPVD